MSGSVELADLRSKPFYELDAQAKTRRRPKRAYVYVVVEAAVTCLVCANYVQLALVYRQLAPTCLGAATAALAQSLNQLLKYKLSNSRLLKFIVWGCINGYFTALWLDVLVAQLDTVAARVVLDQTVGAPLFQFTFTMLSTLWDGETFAGPVIRATFLRSLRYSYCFWPFVSVAMFTVVPPERMVICNCAANFIWNVVLSRLT